VHGSASCAPLRTLDGATKRTVAMLETSVATRLQLPSPCCSIARCRCMSYWGETGSQQRKGKGGARPGQGWGEAGEADKGAEEGGVHQDRKGEQRYAGEEWYINAGKWRGLQGCPVVRYTRKKAAVCCGANKVPPRASTHPGRDWGKVYCSTARGTAHQFAREQTAGSARQTPKHGQPLRTSAPGRQPSVEFHRLNPAAHTVNAAP